MNMKKMNVETRVGLFAIACIAIIAYATIKVGDRSIVVGGGYEMTLQMDSAIGIKTKTPVEIAGIQIGVVKKIKLDDNGKANVVLSISNGVRLPEGTTAYVRAKGFLGETFIEIRRGPNENQTIPEDAAIPYGGVVGDMNVLMGQFNEIAANIKDVTGALKVMIGSDNTSPVYRTVQNLDQFTETMKNITIQNEASMNKIIENLAVLTGELRGVIQARSGDINDTLASLNSITQKVDQGSGTIGKLINDDTTVNKLNDAVDNLNDALGGLRKLETQVGFHTEYLGGTDDFKNYVHLNFLPTPDKALLFEFVSDPNSSPNRMTRDTTITAGGATSTVTTRTATTDNDRFLFSAELAKKFYDFTVRGGVIESTGGIGLDYNRGPLGVQFSAFDFNMDYGERPHLKVLSNVNLTKSIYLVGGADDFINPAQSTDWFVGAGLRFVDEDIKSFIGMGMKAFQ